MSFKVKMCYWNTPLGQVLIEDGRGIRPKLLRSILSFCSDRSGDSTLVLRDYCRGLRVRAKTHCDKCVKVVKVDFVFSCF